MKRSRKSGIPYWAYWGRKGNQPVRRADAPRKVHFEPLEQRVLLSGDFNYAAAQGAALDVMLRLNEGSLEVLDNATRGVLASQALAETDRVVITGAELGDAVTIDYATPFDTPVLFDGGDQAGSAGDLLQILSDAGKSVKIGAGDGASISVSNVEEIFAGTGADTLVGPDADATWTVTDAGTGSVAGVTFSGIENLSGGSGADSFVFAGGSVSSVSGGGGSDTLDLSADAAGVTVDLSSGTATYAGGITGIENVVTGSGSDTLIGALSAVVLNTGAGVDTLDFASVSANLTITVSSDGTLSVTDGASTVTGIAGAENIVTGSGTTTLVFADGASLGAISGSGAVVLDYSAYTTPVTVNLATGAATGTAGIANSVASVIGGSGPDTLIGPATDATWDMTGADAGSVNGMSFTNIENLSGAADNADTIVIGSGGGVSGVVSGGSGGFDTIVVADGDYSVKVYTATGPDSGSISLDGTVIRYVGFEPLTDLDADAATIEFNLTGGADLVEVSSSSAGMLTIDSIDDGFEDHTFTVVGVTSITLNSLDGDDQITLKSPGTYAGSLAINGGGGSDKIVAPDSTNSWTITGAGAGNLTGAVDFGFTGMEILAGGAGDDTLIGRDSDTTWDIAGADEGNIADGGGAAFAFAGLENLAGGGGQDRFVFDDGDGVTGTVDGGGGDNTLDYSAYGPGNNVTVDLGTGTANGTSGVGNIRNVAGGSGDDNITGDSSANRLEGGGGDDTLAGGVGDDTYIFGNDWGHDTIDDPAGQALLQFSQFTGDLRLRTPSATEPEVEGLVAGVVTGTVDYGGGADFITDVTILTTDGELSDGLLALSDLGDELDNLDKLDTPLLPHATAGMTIGGFLDIGGILRAHLWQEVEEYLLADTDRTLDELIGVLNRSGTADDLQFTVDAVGTLAGGVLTIDLGLSATRTISGIDLRLGPQIEEFLVADALTGQLTATLDWNFSVGVDAGGAFFGNFDNDMNVGAEIDLVPDAHFTAHRGFLGLDVKSLGIDADNTDVRILKADLAVDPGSLDADDGGSTSLAELQGADPNALTQSGSAMVGFNLEVRATAGVQGISPASLVFQDDLFDASEPGAPAATGFDASITDFDNTDAGTVLAVLQQFGKSLGIFGSKALNLPIALTDGRTVGDLFDLEALFQQEVLDRLEQQPHTESTFLSELNRGRGVRTMTGLADLEVQLSDGTVFAVDLSPATTLGEIMQLIRDGADAAGVPGGDFEVGIDPERGGLRLVDRTGGTGTFSVAALNFSPALSDLGLEGQSAEEQEDEGGAALVIAANIGFPGPNFDTVQGMLDNLGPVWIHGPAVYDPGTRALRFDLGIDLTGAAVGGAGMALFDMGPLSDLVTASTVDLAPSGTLMLPLELRLTPVGFEAPLSDATALSSLNAGKGIGSNGLETIESAVASARNLDGGIGGELVAAADLFGDADSLVGRNVTITSGPAFGETRTILANTSNTLVLDGEWTTPPASGDGFVIDGSDLQVQLRDGTVFTVELDGVPLATVGDVKALFQAAGGPDFDIRIAGDRLVLVDRSTPPDPIAGIATSASTGSDLVDASADFGPVDGLAGRTVEITGGTGSGQTRRIVGNTGDTLVVEYDWDTPLDTTSEYTVFSTFEVLARYDSPARNDLGLISVGSEQVLTADTPASDANGLLGLGTTESPSTDIGITLRDGTTFEVDLDVLAPGATMGDLMELIQDAATAAGVGSTEFEARIDPGTGKLGLVDRTAGASAFGVSDVNGATAASELGLAGATAVARDVDHDGVDEYVIDFPAGPAFILEGNVLHGDTASAHVGIRLDGDPNLSTGNLALNIALDDSGGIDVASGLWGALGVTATGGDIVSGAVDVAVEFADPGTDAGTDDLLTVRELSEGLGSVEDLIDTLSPGGSFELDLPLLPDTGFAGVTGPAAVLNVTLPDMTDLNTLQLQFTTANDVQSLLEAVNNLTIEEVVSALADAADYLVLLQDQDSLLTYRLPGLDLSLGRILDFGREFKDRIATLSDGVDDPRKLQDLEGALNALSNLSATLAFDTDDSELAIHLTFTPSATAQLPFRLDLTTLGLGEELAELQLDTIGAIQDWTGLDPVPVNAVAAIDFELVIDLKATESSEPLGARNETPYIGGMNSTIAIQVDDSDMNFPSPLGSLPAEVAAGSFKIDEDGAGAGTAPAAYTISLSPGLYSIAGATEIAAAADATTMTLAGALDIDLPLVFPDEIPPDQVPVSLTITDLGDAANTTSLSGPPVRSLQGLVSLLDNLESFPGSFADLFSRLDAAFDEAIFGNVLPLVGSQLAEAVDFIDQIRDKVLANLRRMTPGLTPGDVQQALFEALGPGGLDWLADRDGNLQLNVDDVEIPILTDARIEFALDLVLPAQTLVTPVDLDLALPGLGLEIDALLDVVFGLADGDVSTPEVDPLTLAFGMGGAGAYIKPSSFDNAGFDLEATLRSGVALTGNPALVFRDNGVSGPDTISRDEGNWILDGFRVGQIIAVGATPGGNQGDFEIAHIDPSGTIITLVPGNALTTEGPVDGIDIEVAKVTLTGNPNLAFTDDFVTDPFSGLPFDANLLNTIERDKGSWIADGFRRGQTITVANAGENDGTYEILRIDPTGTTLFVAPGSLTAAGPAGGITVRSDRPRGFDAKMGFLPYRVFDLADVDTAVTDPTRLTGAYSISLNDTPGSTDDRLFATDLTGAVVTASLDGGADINLRLETDLPDGAAFPPYRMDLVVDWAFAGPSIGDSYPSWVKFENVEFELVGFMRDFVGSALSRLEIAFNPLDGLVDFLNSAAFPILSLIFGRAPYATAATFHGGKSEIGDFAGASEIISRIVYGGDLVRAPEDWLNPISKESVPQSLLLDAPFPLNLLNAPEHVQNVVGLAYLSGQAWIDVGSFEIDPVAARDHSAAEDGPPTPVNVHAHEFGKLDDDPGTILGDIRHVASTQPTGAGDAALGFMATQLLPGRTSAIGDIFGGAIRFFFKGTDPIEVPILNDAAQAFDLILGRTVIGDAADEESSRLLSYGTPELFLMLYQDIPLSKKEIAKKIFKSGALGEALTLFGIDIVAYLAIAFEARADFQIEYDTTGLNAYATTGNPYDIVDGLYFDDAEGIDERSITGGTFSFLHDEDQARIMGGLGLGVAVQINLSILKFKLGIEGIVFIGEGRDFNDPNDDLKLRAHEFDALLLAEPAPLRSFDDNIYSIGIATEFRLDVFAKVFLEFFFFKLTIIDFRANLLTLQPPNIPLPGASINLPPLAVESNSDLVLQIGDNDSKTVYVGFDEATNRFIVSRMSYTDTYNYETRQFNVAGAGEHSRNYFRTYDATGVARIVGTGGTGGDTIIVAPEVTVPVEIHGGAGNDVLIGGAGAAALYGDGGEDYLQAGSGGGAFFGGDDDDVIHGGNAVDVIHGGLGDDRLLGWRGDDAIYGDEGRDLIDGGTGADVIDGGSGDDVILGRLDDDQIHGGGGSDIIEGGDGRDRIFGDEGDDIIRGGYGNDEIDGGSGADEIFGQRNSDLIRGGADEDWIDGGGATDVVFGDSGPSPVSGPDGNDVIVSRQGDDYLDGEGGNDAYLVSFQGGVTSSLVTVLDTGSQSGTDAFVATGTILDDLFLLRASTDGSLAFVALLNDPADKVERINYTGVERIVVNAGDGDDRFAVDDTAAEATLNGEAGDDSFQIGQIFRSPRTEAQANLSVDDEFATIEVTRGFLSNGISAPMTVNGGTGIDDFVVFHNRAVLTLRGDEGDDVFEVRAFALAGSQEPQRARTDISGGAGADLVQYAVNAPVNIDGGDGLDTLVVYGTEFGDDFVITEDGVFGAGLTVNFVNIELLNVDGAEGDDRFFVKSTSEKFMTELFGGLGSDTFNMSGDTPPVVSNDLLGHSGVVLHDVESGDPAFDGQTLFGISANVADNDEPFVVVRQTDGSTIVTEGGSLVDTYEVVLTRQPDTNVFVKALAPIPTPDERELRERAFRLSSTSPTAVTTPDGTGLTLTFTPADWYIPQLVEVRADGATMQDAAGLFTRPELGDGPSFSFDDDAREGVSFGVINHLVTAGSRSVQGYPVALTPSPTLTIPIPAGANLADFIPSRLVGRTVSITGGDGMGQQRVVTAAEIDAAAGEITLVLDRAWLVSAVPTTASEFSLQLDAADVTGQPLAVTNPTVTIPDPGGMTPAELLGRRLEIVSGSGAGQSRFIVGAEDPGDGTFMLTLDRGWLLTDLPSAGNVTEQSQTQTDNVFAPNVLTFEFDAGSLGPAGDGVLTVSAIADLDAASEYLTLNAEGVLSQNLFVTGGQQYSPVTTTINLSRADLETMAYDGKITFTVTPSSEVDDFSWYYGSNKLTLQLSFPVQDSGFLLRIDDAFVGTMTAFDESAFPDPDDRTTFTDADAAFSTAGEGLAGAILQIVGGPGAGQQRLILGNLESDPTRTLVLNGPWRTDPVPGESVYRIERYDGLAIPSVQVQVNDNDAAGLIVDETRGFENAVVDDFDTVTAVIEGGDGDHLGEQDVLRVRLSRDPGATGVNVSLLFDGSQLELKTLDGTPVSSLLFDSGNWSSFQAVVVSANDDLKREGFHTSLIEFRIAAGEADATMTQTDSFREIPEDEAVFFVGLGHVPLEGTVVVTHNGDLLTENTDYLVKANKVIFVDAEGGEATRAGEIVVTYDYTVPGFLGAFTTPVLVRINDNDAPTVLVRETDGSTDVIEALPQATASVELLANGSFEAGFSGWTTNAVGTPFIPWRVTGGGAGSGYGMALTSPQDGSSVAWNGFDGSASTEFRMYQDVTISADTATATLTWHDRVQWNFRLGGYAGQPRPYAVQVLDPGTGDLLDTVYSFSTGTQADSLAGDTGWQTHTADLSAFSGRTIRLLFREYIPQSFTGPGQIEFDAISLTETVATDPEDDSYELLLTGQPTGDVAVTVTPDITKTTRTGGIRHDEIQVEISSSDPRAVPEMADGIPTGNLIVTFDDTNWDDPVSITVRAKDDGFVDGGDTQVFAPGPSTLSGILGPVFVEGGGGQGSLGIGPPVMLPGETNVKEKTGDVVSVSGTAVTVLTADLEAILPELGLADVSELVDKTIAVTAVADPGNPTHSAIDQFRRIVGVDPGQAGGETVLTINGPYDLLPGESDADIRSYAVTAESLNFFVDESKQVDYMFVHDEDSPADSSGVLTSTRLSGLNMGPDLVFNGQRRPGGITYGDLEVLEINLGTGGNDFEVLGTHTRDDGYRTWTFLYAGNDIPYRDILGDEITVILNAQEVLTASGTVGGAGNPEPGSNIFETTVTIEQAFPDGALAGQLIEIGGTSQAADQTRRILGNTGNVLTVDRPWEFLPVGEPYAIIDEADGDFALDTQGGDDSVDASATTLPLVVFGGDGSDTIEGGQAEDIVFGDSGRVDYCNENGMIVTRLGMARETIDPRHVTSASSSDPLFGNRPTLTDADASFPLDNQGLAGLVVAITDGKGVGQTRLIVGNTGNTLILAESWESGQIPDDTSKYRISLVPEDQTDGVVRDPRFIFARDLGEGGDDVLQGMVGSDILIGGAAGDVIDGDEDDDLIFGDAASLARRDTDPALVGDITNPRFQALLGQVIYSRTDLPAASQGVAGLPSGDESGQALVDGIARDYRNPDGTAPSWAEYEIIDLHHSADIEAGNVPELVGSFGDDSIAGGAGNDVIFGQLGNDTVQGDGSIDSAVAGSPEPVGARRVVDQDEPTIALTPTLQQPRMALEITASFEAATDGDDYIEGNGGDDVIFGNLGQDDIVGGSSGLFTLLSPDLRPDGSDIIFGGAGTRIDRDHDVNDANRDTIVLDERHAEDSDAIAGDNADIYRLVGIGGADGGSFLAFQYDRNEYEDRGAQRIIVRAVELLDYTPGGSDFDEASAESDRGLSDEIHGESGDDFIYGMVGRDVLFGDSEDDDLIGGRDADWISGGTGIDGILGDDGRILTSRNTPNDATWPGEPLYGVAGFESNQLDLLISTPGRIQQSSINPEGALKKTADLTPFNLTAKDLDDDVNDEPLHADDILFGGLGGDFMHGGAGDDAMSGAEALPEYFAAPFNPGDLLRFGDHSRAGEFYDYDEYHALDKLATFLLNWSAADGPETAAGSGIHTDGDDVMFGDLGNDWMAGGTGRDHLYGGFGNDLLDGDDDKDTSGGPKGGNNDPDGSQPSYEDIAYGGAGRDVLIANTGGDRLIDWVGEFNSFLVPFAPYGPATISRALQPQIMEYLYSRSESDGGDPTRIEDGGDPARNGEPWGELGVVCQQDAAWQEQTGAPLDPQAGNIPGGARDVLRSANFNTGSMEAFFPDSGAWEVNSGALRVSAGSLGGDAAAVFHVDQYLPKYFEIMATIATDKPTAGWKANAYLIFDYFGPEDFKFAGLNASTNKIEMGRRAAGGWVVDVQTPLQVKPNQFYNLLLAVNGTTVTLVVNNAKAFSYVYAPRIVDGYSYGINAGMVGFGSDNSKGIFDNIAVRKLAPQVTFEHAEDFSDGLADLFRGARSGDWQVAGGRYVGVPSAGDRAVSLVDLGIGRGLEAASILEFETTLGTQGRGGIVYDYYTPVDFKFVAVDASTNQVIIGHHTSKGWFTDALASRTIGLGDHRLGVSLKGTTVSVTLDGQAVAGFVYNAVVVDGAFGLLSVNGSSSFDSVTFRTDDPAFRASVAGAKLVALASVPPADGAVTLSYESLGPILSEAVDRLAASTEADPDAVSWLNSAAFLITDLPGDTLGMAQGFTILLDSDAAGYGWSADGMDLLSAVEHELGHILGLDHVEGTIMSPTLSAGERLTLSAGQDPVRSSILRPEADLLAPSLHGSGWDVSGSGLHWGSDWSVDIAVLSAMYGRGNDDRMSMYEGTGLYADAGRLRDFSPAEFGKDWEVDLGCDGAAGKGRSLARKGRQF